MPDEIDRGCEREEQDRQRALDAVTSRPAMQPVGFCYNCDEIVLQGCFCDADCRDDFEKQLKLKRNLGYAG
jgi:hypothetical protein